MGLRVAVLTCLGVLTCGLLGAWAGTSDPGGGCVSHYEAVASAPTWGALKKAMLDHKQQGRVVSLRTQARGHDVGAGDQDAVRVMDLLDRKGRRIVQVDVWRTEAGAWRAGAWSQCID